MVWIFAWRLVGLRACRGEGDEDEEGVLMETRI
jgi:hypothetical protein